MASFKPPSHSGLKERLEYLREQLRLLLRASDVPPRFGKPHAQEISERGFEAAIRHAVTVEACLQRAVSQYDPNEPEGALESAGPSKVGTALSREGRLARHRRAMPGLLCKTPGLEDEVLPLLESSRKSLSGGPGASSAVRGPLDHRRTLETAQEPLGFSGLVGSQPARRGSANSVLTYISSPLLMVGAASLLGFAARAAIRRRHFSQEAQVDG